jgi:Asp-tRNA(Asn)/Glu-tRNA(Gln) amidotransferase B subunit
MTWEPVIGLEIHVQLKDATRRCSAAAPSDSERGENTQTCPVCLGFPVRCR